MRTFLKWTGSKRLQSDFIIDKFPKESEERMIREALYTNYEEEEKKDEGVCMWF